MEANNIMSTVGAQTSAPVQFEKTRQAKELDQTLSKKFASMLEQEEQKTEMKESAKSNISNSSTDKKAEEKQEAHAQDHVKKEIEKQVREKMMKMSPMLNYLYNLMYKDPNALSLLEKQSLGLDKTQMMQKMDVEYGEFKKMLTQRGMKLGDLSFVQMSKLAQMNTKSSVTAFLDQLSKERKMHGVEEKEETTLVERGKENMARRMEGSQELTGQASPAADLKEAMEGRPVPSDRAKELAERKEVVDQIVRHVEIRNLNSRDELVMRLNPEYLGELKLKISKEGGKMSALFETTSQEVRAIIEESADELTSMFGSKGLTLTGAKVKLVGSIE